MDIPALPFCKTILKAKKPLPPAYPKYLKTLGDHLKKKRLDLKLPLKDVARRIGVNTGSIRAWEAGHATPSLPKTPRLIAFLGYIPFEKPPDNLSGKIKAFRRTLGLTQKELAERLKINPSTLARWERRKGRPSKELLEKMNHLFSSFSPSISDSKE